MKSHLLILFGLLGFVVTTFSQNKHDLSDQVIVKLRPDVKPESFLNQFVASKKLNAVFYSGTPSTSRRLSVLEYLSLIHI